MEYKIIDESTGEIEVAGNKFEAQPTGLTINGEPTYEEWELYGKHLEFYEGAIQWLIGDWLNYGEVNWKELYTQQLDETQYNTWRTYKWVSEKIDYDRRLSNLSWSHHQEVADFEPVKQDELLDLAINNHWSVRELRAECHKRKALPVPPLQPGEYRIIYADPPWQFDNSGFAQSAASHYDTMSTEDICNMNIPKADNSVLFMWATNAMLEDALKVIEAWGFEYKTNFVWTKTKGPTIGFYVQSRHELLMIGTRGSGMLPEVRPISILTGEVTKHSKKPDKVYKLIEEMYDGPYIELFARQAQDGWDRWGNEADPED